MYDIIIIGAGAAGITAAIYAARANLKFEIISKDVGGLTLWSPDIENYTGLHKLTGIELVEIPRVSTLNDTQIKADLGAIKALGADGLALSWDLWHMPLERLELVRSVWCKPS